MVARRKSSLSKIALVLVGVFAISTALLAQTVAETAARWGILGTWQTDCSAPLSRDNSSYTYVVRGDRLFLDRSYGDTNDSSMITSATITAKGELALVVNFAKYSQTNENVLTKGVDGRYHVSQNRNVDTNEYSVRDGKLTSSGNPTRWVTRCR